MDPAIAALFGTIVTAVGGVAVALITARANITSAVAVAVAPKDAEIARLRELLAHHQIDPDAKGGG